MKKLVSNMWMLIIAVVLFLADAPLSGESVRGGALLFLKDA